MQRRSVLVVGASSMLAQHITVRLRAVDTHVWSAGRHPDNDLYLDLSAFEPPDTGTMQVDSVIHCAASFLGDSPAGMRENAKINALGAILVGEVALRVGARHIVFVSSLFAIDHPENEYFGSYGLSKQQGAENLEFALRTEWSEPHDRLAQSNRGCGRP